MAKIVPAYSGMLRSHAITVPTCINNCSGIRVFGRRIKSLVFTTDVAIIKNINADAILAVYPFTPQTSIARSIIAISDVPVFVGVGGGLTTGTRSVQLAEQAEQQGASGVVLNAPAANLVVSQIKAEIEIPIIVTVVSERADIAARLRAGADIINVSAGKKTAEVVAGIRARYPDVAIIATGGPTDESICETINAGANAITYVPPGSGDLFSAIMAQYREEE